MNASGSRNRLTVLTLEAVAEVCACRAKGWITSRGVQGRVGIAGDAYLVLDSDICLKTRRRTGPRPQVSKSSGSFA